MSTVVLTYLLKVAMLVAAFSLMFHLFVRKDTFHRVGRLVLVVSLFAAYVLPLCTVKRHIVQKVPQVEAARQLTAYQTEHADYISARDSEPASAAAVQPAQTMHKGISWLQIAIAVYLAGVLFVLCRIAFSYMRVYSIIRRCRKVSETDSMTILVSDDNIQPFSWMNWIVLPAKDLNNRAILAHEKVHVAMHHSRELLMVDLMSLLQWFNPAVWMLRRDLCSLHEYEADAGVLASGYDMDDYQNVLINRAVVAAPVPFTNSFHASSLRERISMINRRGSKPRVLLKLAYIPVIVGLWLAATALTVYDPVVVEPDINREVGPNWAPFDRNASIDESMERATAQLRESPEFKAYMEQMHRPVETAPENGGKVNGHILDVNGNPILYRPVKASERDKAGNIVKQCIVSEGDGYFQITGIADIKHDLVFEADGYAPQTFAFDRGNYEIRLKPVPSTLKAGDAINGQVVLGHWANPGGVLVQELDANGKEVARTYTDQGMFSFNVVKPGNTIKVSTSGFEPFTAPIDIPYYSIVLNEN